MDRPNLKTSPVIIKLRKSEEVSENDVDLLLSLSKVTPIPFDLNQSAEDSSKMSPSGLSEKLKTAVKERRTPPRASKKKRSFDSEVPSLVVVQRRSLTTDLSKLSDNKLDSLHGGDKSKKSKLKKPPLVMQPSNLPSDRLLDVRHGGGGIESSVLESSSSSTSKKPHRKGKEKSVKKDVKSSNCKVSKQSDKLPSAANKIKKEQAKNTCKESLSKKTSTKSSSNLLSRDILIINLTRNKTDLCKNKSLLESLNFEKSKEISNVKSNKKLSKDKKASGEGASTGSGQITCQRQSQIIHLSKLSDNKLDNLSGRDESNKSKVSSLVLQASNLYPNQISNTEFGRVETPSPIQSSSITAKKTLSLQGKNEPPKKKIKLSDNKEEKKFDESSLQSKDIKKVEVLLERINVKDSSLSLSETEMLIDSDEIKVEAVELKIPEPNVTLESVYSHANELHDRVFVDESKESDLISESEKKLHETPVTELTIASNSLTNNENSESKVSTVLHSFDFSSGSDSGKSETLKSECKLDLGESSTVIICEGVKKDNDIAEPIDKVPDDQELSEDVPSIQTDLDDNLKLDSPNGLDEPVMEFDILDEFESNDNDPEDMDSEDDSDISANEIDAMLDEGLGNYGKQNGLGSDMQHEEKQKVILKVRSKDHFEVLPEGWIEVTHNSGMPIYLHKQTRVCCVSKPYFLGPGSTRKHEIPITAIPCLHYLKQLEKEEEEKNLKNARNEAAKENIDANETNVFCSVEKNSDNSIPRIKDEVDVSVDKSESKTLTSNKKNENSVVKCPMSSIRAQDKGSTLVLPSAKLESVKDIKITGSLDYMAVRNYCKKRFEFQTITVKRFKTWCGRRRHQKQLKRKQRPFLPDNTQLITCPLPSSADKSTTVGNTSKREFIMNPTGKSPVCILHEYVQHTLRVQPKYIFKELESASTPYGAVVLINEMEYGTGYGSSKKVAKSDAAKSALEVLIPKIKKFVPERHSDDDELQDVEFFDQVRVEDPRVSELSVKAGQPYPYQILLECLKRNYGMGDTEVNIEMKNLKHQKNEFIMKVGKHHATVVCKNKRDGKHRASQSILQQLHPHINSWGSLLRMYGKGSCKTLKEKKEEEQRITELQSKACVNKPNISILNKLKEEMLKYSEKMKSKKPIGKLIPERMKFFTISNSNLKSIEL